MGYSKISSFLLALFLFAWTFLNTFTSFIMDSRYMPVKNPTLGSKKFTIITFVSIAQNWLLCRTFLTFFAGIAIACWITLFAFVVLTVHYSSKLCFCDHYQLLYVEISSSAITSECYYQVKNSYIPNMILVKHFKITYLPWQC